MNAPVTPKLAALVYRKTKGCRQYAFPDADSLQAWAARHPYKNETLRVHVATADRRFLPVVELPAAQAAAYVRQQGGTA
jgi:hypothetical protein